MITEEKPRFRRPVPGRRSPATDASGRVQILVRLFAHNKPVKGNMCRTICIEGSQVSVVFDAIERALLG